MKSAASSLFTQKLLLSVFARARSTANFIAVSLSILKYLHLLPLKILVISTTTDFDSGRRNSYPERRSPPHDNGPKRNSRRFRRK